MTKRRPHRLIYDWAESGPHRAEWPQGVMLDDETLRDGLQSPSATDPPVETKVELLHLMDRLGIETADVGLPGAGKRQQDAVVRLCREIVDCRLRIQPNCAARTMLVDIEPIVETVQKTGATIECCVFIGSSPIRQYAEDWDLEQILRFTHEAVSFAVHEGLPVMYVTEDTIRSAPEDLRVLLTAAIDAGAQRVCLCDTVGAAVPEGVMNLVTWVQGLIEELGVDVGIDWHGHRDRGMDLANTLAAIRAGATRVHGTALGVGERVGNTPMEQLLVNLRLLGIRDDDLSCLTEYADLAATAIGVPVPVNTPIVGNDAFRTATGVHAAAVIKAARKGHAWLADRIYSGVPAGWIGREQQIEIGPMSGLSNIRYYLAARGLTSTPEIEQGLLDASKESNHVLTEAEIREIVDKQSKQPPT
jgi:2-isopropylmalate synthase